MQILLINVVNIIACNDTSAFNILFRQFMKLGQCSCIVHLLLPLLVALVALD